MAHLLLGPGAVDDHGAGVQDGGQPLHMGHHRLGIGGQQEEIQLLHPLVGELPVDGVGDLGEFGDGFVRVPAVDGDGPVPAEGLGQGTADEPQSDDADLHSAIASRILKMRRAARAKASGVRDWAPSHRAWGGSLWTSIMMPSAPAAAAAMAMDSTR